MSKLKPWTNRVSDPANVAYRYYCVDCNYDIIRNGVWRASNGAPMHTIDGDNHVLRGLTMPYDRYQELTDD